MKINDIDVLTLKGVDDAELLDLHNRFHQTFGAIAKQTGELQKGFGLLTIEMGCRGLDFKPLRKTEEVETEAEVEIQPVEKQLDFKPGDKGTGVVQTHERGLSEDQVKLLGANFHFGVKPVELTPGQMKELAEIGTQPWKSAIQKASEGNSSQLAKIIGSIDKEKLTTSQRKLLALIDPVSIHTDIRLRPDGKSYWEGGEGFTPGNQYQVNKFVELEEGKKILGNFKVATVPEAKGKTDVVQGPLVWMTVGDKKPRVFPPGAAGSTSKAWSRYKIIDKFKWEAGVQDNHFKEFLFSDGKTLDGRWIFQYVPLPDGRREWMISRPNDQKFPSKPIEEKTEKAFVTDIIKVDDEKRLVTGVVLEPEIFDLQDHIYSLGTIEKAAHRFLAMYNLATTSGVMHKDYTRPIDIVESYVAPKAMTIGTQKIKKGTWMMTMKINDDEAWRQVKAGELTGFSIKGVALAQALKETEET